MVKNSFFALVIAGLCFGQGSESAFDSDVSLMLSRSIYIKPHDQINNLPMNEMAFNTAHNISMLNAYTLIMQAEGESLQPKTSCWKQVGIYGLELVGAGSGAGLSFINAAVCSGLAGGPDFSTTKFYSYYVIGNMLIASTCTWCVGRLVKQKGCWWHASIGAGLGSMLGIIPEFLDPGHTELLSLRGALFFCTPALGAVIGLNL